MSTVTKIKGNLDNIDLPVLTSQGLISQILGKYVNRLSEKGYTLTTSKLNAISAFCDVLTENEIGDCIKTIFPFIGSSTNKDAAKVPIIGDVEFNFTDSFDDFVYDASNNIKGISSTPLIDTLNLGDIQNQDIIGAAFSINKKDTSGTGTYFDRIVDFTNSSYQVRLQNNHLAFYTTKSGGSKDVAIQNDNLSNSEDSGSIYMLGLLQGGNYVRCARKETEMSSASGTISFIPAIPYADLSNTLRATSTYIAINYVTSLTFFRKMLTRGQGIVYIDAIKTLMEALGKV